MTEIDKLLKLVKEDLDMFQGTTQANINSLITTIESQKEEIAKLNNRIVPDMSCITQNEYNQIKWISAEYGADYLINVVKHIAFLEGDKQMSETITEQYAVRIIELASALADQKAITGLALKGLKEIKSMEFHEGAATPEQRIAIRTIAEIARLQNDLIS